MSASLRRAMRSKTCRPTAYSKENKYTTTIAQRMLLLTHVTHKSDVKLEEDPGVSAIYSEDFEHYLLICYHFIYLWKARQLAKVMFFLICFFFKTAVCIKLF